MKSLSTWEIKHNHQKNDFSYSVVSKYKQLLNYIQGIFVMKLWKFKNFIVIN